MRHLLSVICFLLICAAVRSQAPMQAHFIDVGQGSATLLEFPAGAVLIDTGGESSDETGFDSTEVLQQYLDAFFTRRTDLARRLDLLILTHPHIDHTRGVKMVLERYRPRNGVTDGLTAGSGRFGQIALHEYADDSQANNDTSDDVGLEEVEDDDFAEDQALTNAVIDPLNPAEGNPQFRILSGSHQSRGQGWSKKEFENENNHSVIVRVDYGEASLLFTGDLEEQGIDDLVENYESTDLLDADVYLVGHHGSRNGTTPALVRAISPEIAVISMGPFDRQSDWTAYAYGHPNRGILDQLQVGIDRTRPLKTVQAGDGARNFADYEIDRAIYATGWDGTIVLSGTWQGAWTLSSDAPGLLNINTATVEDLCNLPRIGPVRASAIVAYRENHGPFQTVDELLDVTGIGPTIMAEIRALVTVN